MEVVRLVAAIVQVVLAIYILVLLVRLVLDYIPLFNRQWRPHGAGLVAAELVYTVTDPPIRLFRRLVPPVRIGPMALDLGFTFTLLACLILQAILRYVL